MDQVNIARDIAFVCVCAFIGGSLAKKLNLSLVVGYILSGIFFSSLLGKLISNQSNLNAIADMGIAFLLFSLGIEFSFQRLSKIKEIALKGVLLQIILTTIILIVVTLLFRFSFYEALFFGIVVSLSSTAVIVKILAEKGELETQSGEISINWLLLQDLAVLPISLLLPVFLKMQNTPIIPEIIDLFLNLGKTVIIIYLLLMFGKKIIPKILDSVGSLNSRELILIASVSFSILSAYLSLSFGFSFAIGAFLAGLLLSVSSHNHAIFSEIRPIRDLFSLIFFVLLGMMIDIGFVFTNLVLIICLSIIVIFVKYLVVLCLMLVLKYHPKVSHQVALNLSQVGEFAFVLSIVAVKAKNISPYLYSLIISVSLVTIILTPFLMAKTNWFYLFWEKNLKRFFPKIYTHFFEVKKAELNFLKDNLSFENHVVICGYGRVGKHIGVVLESFCIPFIVIDNNQNVVKNLKEKDIPVIYGDPTDVGVLDFAEVDKAKTLIIAIPDRFSQEQIIINSLNLNRQIKIICRSHVDHDRPNLLAIGAQSIVSPEFEASLSIAQKVLNDYQISPQVIADSLKTFREFQEK